AGRGAAGRGHRPHEHHHQLEGARDLPAEEIARGGVAPHVTRQRAARTSDLARHFLDAGGGHSGLPLREGRRVRGVDLAEGALELLEAHGDARPLVDQVLLPVDPAPDELAVPRAVTEEHVREGEEEGGFRARPRREPVVRHGGGVAQARVDHAHLGARHLSLDDALRVGVEVVSRLEVGGEEEDEAGAAVVRRGAVEAVPEGVAGARGSGADGGVAVVAGAAPRVEGALGVDQFVPGAARVIHDLLLPSLEEGCTNAAADIVQHLVPGDTLPLTTPARAGTAKRIKDALGVLHLVQGGWSLGAVPPAAPRMLGIALELLDLERLLVHVGEQAAPGLAVEANGGHQAVAPGDTARPGARIELLPIAPAIDGRIAIETARGRIEVARVRVKRLRRRAGGEVRHGVLTRAAAPAPRAPTGLPRARGRTERGGKPGSSLQERTGP